MGVLSLATQARQDSLAYLGPLGGGLTAVGCGLLTALEFGGPCSVPVCVGRTVQTRQHLGSDAHPVRLGEAEHVAQELAGGIRHAPQSSNGYRCPTESSQWRNGAARLRAQAQPG